MRKGINYVSYLWDNDHNEQHVPGITFRIDDNIGYLALCLLDLC